jgi:hypothetical protein
MAQASKKHTGAGGGEKRAGTGAMTEIDHGKVGENDILSNRDKSLHGKARGQDSKGIQVDQLQDSASNRTGRTL